MSIKGIIFDFDGTLFDSMGIWRTAGEEYLASLGIEAEAELGKKLKTMSFLQSAEYLRDTYRLPMTVEQIIDGVNKTVEDFYFHRACPKENVAEFIQSLHDRGVKMCVATASDRYLVEAALRRCDMLRYFDSVFTCNEAGHGKDEPYIFELARSFMGTDRAETAVFEDAYYAAKTAKDAGFFVVGIYDRYEKSADDLKATSDVYVGGFSEIGEQLHI